MRGEESGARGYFPVGANPYVRPRVCNSIPRRSTYQGLILSKAARHLGQSPFEIITYSLLLSAGGSAPTIPHLLPLAPHHQ